MLIEFTVPMEGPRTEAAPRGVSRRPGHQEDVDPAEAERLISRGMAIEVVDGAAMKETPMQNANRNRQPETATAKPPIERATRVPTPLAPAEAGARKGGKAS